MRSNLLNEAYKFLKGRINTDVPSIAAHSHSLIVSTLSTNVCLFLNQDPLQSEASLINVGTSKKLCV